MSILVRDSDYTLIGFTRIPTGPFSGKVVQLYIVKNSAMLDDMLLDNQEMGDGTQAKALNDGHVYVLIDRKWELNTTVVDKGTLDEINDRIDQILLSMSGASMPSEYSMDIAYPDNGDIYVAEDDGYLSFGKTATAANQYIELTCNGLTSIVYSAGVSENLYTFIPMKKGATATILYNAAGSNLFFRFVYAVGAWK